MSNHDASGGPISPTQRAVGLLAIVAIFVALGFGVQALRALPAAPPPPVAAVPSPTVVEETPTPEETPGAPLPIPDEARTSVYRSDTKASGEFVNSTILREPVMKTKNTNRYIVRVETTTKVDADAAAEIVQAALDAERGWAAYRNNNFRLIDDPMLARLVVTIASPETTDKLCGPEAKTEGLWSCYFENGTDRQVVINSDRWHYMVPNFNNLDQYRTWVVNHHVGLYLGQGVAQCGGPGQEAPTMAEQDRNLGGCIPNAWPRPARKA